MGSASVNFREGMRRLAIVLGVLGCFIGGLYSYLLGKEVYNSYVTGVLKESLIVDCAILVALPAFGFLIPWAAIRVLAWIWTGFSN